VIPTHDGPLLVITNYEKIAGITPRRQRVPLDSISPDHGSSSHLSLASVEKLTSLAESAQKTAAPVLSADPSNPGRLRTLSGETIVEAARILGWPRLTAIILPPETPTRGLDLEKAMKIVRDTPLSRSLRRPWDLAIFDEAQALKNPTSQRSIAVLGPRGLYRQAHRSLFLSGTPLENYPKEIWPLAAALCPAKFGDWWTFARRYCGNHSELQQRLRTTFMIRRLKSDVLKELPPKRRQMVLLAAQIDWSKYPEFQRWRELYEKAYEEALAHMEAARTDAEYKSAARKLETVTVPFTETSDLRHKTSLLKLPACLSYTDEMLSSGLDCLVIYAHHQDVLATISKHYGDQSCVIYGDTPMNDRIPIVQEFQEGRKKIFIGGLRAAGVGITLTRASTVVFFETDWNPATMKQAEDRLCRIGQKKMVHVIHPVLDGSLDANMVQKMLSKQEAIDRVLDRPPEQEKTRNPAKP
jgi:SWI/SNF-related matrix-associated actin-dependent regulator 1 of chromatin subfamily A